jgi:hypothetical protein
MRCLYCGKGLALFKRLRGGGEFCSDAHRQQYQERYNELALNRLLQAKPPEEAPRKLEQTSDLGLEQTLVPAAAQAKSQNGHGAPGSGASGSGTPGSGTPGSGNPGNGNPGRAAPDTRIAAANPTPPSEPVPATATLTGTHATALMERQEPGRSPEAQSPEVKAPAPAASFVKELPGAQNAVTARLVFPELEFCAVLRPGILRREVTPLVEQAATLGANGPCHAERLPLVAAPLADFRTGLRGRGPEMRAPVRAEPVATFVLSPLGGEECGRPDQPLAFSIPAWPPEDTAAAWQESAREFPPVPLELGDLARLAFAAAGFAAGTVVVPGEETEQTVGAPAETPQPMVVLAPEEPRGDQLPGVELPGDELPGDERAEDELPADGLSRATEDPEPERAPATPMWIAPQEHQPTFLMAAIEPVRMEPVHIEPVQIDPLFLQTLRGWSPPAEPEMAAEPELAAVPEPEPEPTPFVKPEASGPEMSAESVPAVEPVQVAAVVPSPDLPSPDFPSLEGESYLAAPEPAFESPAEALSPNPQADTPPVGGETPQDPVPPPEAESYVSAPEPAFEATAEALSPIPWADTPPVNGDTPQDPPPPPEAEAHFAAPEPVTQPLPLVLPGLAAGRGRPVQVFPAGLAASVAIQIPRAGALPLRPLMVLGPAPAVPDAVPSAVATPSIPLEKPAQAPASTKPPVPAETKTTATAQASEVVTEPRTKEPRAKEPPTGEPRTGEIHTGAAASPQGSATPNPPIPDVDLGLPSLVLDGGPRSSKIPATPVMIALAAALIVVIGGAFYLMSSGKGKSAPVAPDAAVSDVVEAGAPLSIADGGWIDDWAPQPPNPKVLRVLSIMRGSLPLSDYRMEFEAQIESKALGWVFRALDQKNYYVTKLEIVKPGIEPVVEVVHFAMIDGEEVQPRTRVPLPVKVRVDTSYKIRFEALGDRFTTYVQDRKVDEWNDSRIAKGGVGMYRERDESAPLKDSVRLVLIARKKP